MHTVALAEKLHWSWLGVEQQVQGQPNSAHGASHADLQVLTTKLRAVILACRSRDRGERLSHVLVTEAKTAGRQIPEPEVRIAPCKHWFKLPSLQGSGMC